MSNQADNRLRNHIIEVFDNYQDTSADASWLLLRERFPDKKRKTPAIWWLAAAVLLMAGLGLFLFIPQQRQTLSYKPKQQKPVNAPEILKKSGSTDDKPVAKSASSISKNAPYSIANRLSVEQGMSKYSNLSAIANNIAFNKPVIVNIIPLVPLNNSKPADSLHSILTTSLAKGKTAPAEILGGLTAVKDQSVKDSTLKGNNVAVDLQKTKSIQDLLNADNARQNATNHSSEKILIPKKSVVLSAYAATYFNYAKGSSNQVNVGGGITSDFKVSNRLKLSTGLYVAQNTLSYNSTSIPQAVNNSALTIANTGSKLYADPAASNATPLNYIASPAINNFNANLLGLDIPINLKYQFNPAKNDTYVAAGLSSGTYISETYSSAYNYSNIYGNSTLAQPQEATNRQHFNTFDFAKTLNLSFGVGYPLGKTNRLIVEPFLKYPLGGLGSQNIRFGASGINLKLNLNNPKK